MTAQRWNWLWQRERPHAGQLTLWGVLVCAAGLASYFLTHPPQPLPGAERAGPASVLSCLPDPVLLAPATFYASGAAFALGAVLWALGRGVPWSGWLTALGFTTLMALQMEGSSQTTHVAHATNLLLIVNALWYHCDAPEIRRAQTAGLFWQTPLHPGWVYGLSVFCLGVFYGWSGLTKLKASGFAWPNGLSLQLWVRLWGDPDSWATQLILADRRLARFLQTTTLLGELGGLVAVVSRRLRPLVGLALIGFHGGAITVFGWGFHANVVLLALVFLPFPEGIRWLLARQERARAQQTNAVSPSSIGRMVTLAPDINR
jgi:hypothetical protein